MAVTSMNMDDQKRANDHLDTLLLEGLNSGDPIPVNAELWTELKRAAMARLEDSRKTGD